MECGLLDNFVIISRAITVSPGNGLDDAYQLSQFRGADASGDSTFMPGGYSLTLTQPILHYDDIFCGDQTDKRIVQAEADFPAALIAITPAPAKIIYWTTCV